MAEVDLPKFLIRPLLDPEELAAPLDFVAPAAGSHVLPVPLETQEMDNWCWAAVTAAVEAFYQEPGAETQCEIATRWLGEPCCPPTQDKTDPLQNSMYNLVRAMGGNAAGGALGGQFGDEALRQEIDGQHPLCCILGANGSASHVILAVGYTDAGDIVLNDPAIPGLQYIALSAFRAAYAHGGTWIDSLLTQKA